MAATECTDYVWQVQMVGMSVEQWLQLTGCSADQQWRADHS